LDLSKDERTNLFIIKVFTIGSAFTSSPAIKKKKEKSIKIDDSDATNADKDVEDVKPF